MSESPTTVSFQWGWTRDQHVRAERAIWAHRSKRARGLLAFALFLPLFGLAMAVGTGRGAQYGLYMAMFVLVGAGIGWLVGPRVNMRVRARRFQKTCLPDHEQQTAMLSDHGMEIGSTSASTKIKWSVFKRWVETDDFFLLYFDRVTGYYLPKSAATPATVATARALISGGIGAGNDALYVDDSTG